MATGSYVAALAVIGGTTAARVALSVGSPLRGSASTSKLRGDYPLIMTSFYNGHFSFLISCCKAHEE